MRGWAAGLVGGSQDPSLGDSGEEAGKPDYCDKRVLVESNAQSQ